MFTRKVSLFAALIFSAQAEAQQALDHPADLHDAETRIMRAKGIIEKLDQPADRGGVMPDEADLNKVPSTDLAQNFKNFTNFTNFRNFTNFTNFTNC